MKFLTKCLAIFFIFIWNISLGFETNVGAAGGKGYVKLEDGSKIEGLWKVERGILSKCKNCLTTYPDGGKVESNVIVNDAQTGYISIGKFKFTGDIYDYEGRSYKVVYEGIAKKSGTEEWDTSGEVSVVYKNEKNIFNVKTFNDAPDLLKEKYYPKIVIKNDDNNTNIQSNKSNIELAKNECSELGLETGTEKFADCVLQISK